MLYTPLTREQITEIMGLMIRDLEKRLSERRLTVQLTEAARRFIIENGYDSAYGARPLKRFIQRTVETAIAKLLIRESVPEGSTLIVDAVNDEISVSYKQNLLNE